MAVSDQVEERVISEKIKNVVNTNPRQILNYLNIDNPLKGVGEWVQNNPDKINEISGGMMSGSLVSSVSKDSINAIKGVKNIDNISDSLKCIKNCSSVLKLVKMSPISMAVAMGVQLNENYEMSKNRDDIRELYSDKVETLIDLKKYLSEKYGSLNYSHEYLMDIDEKYRESMEKIESIQNRIDELRGRTFAKSMITEDSRSFAEEYSRNVKKEYNPVIGGILGGGAEAMGWLSYTATKLGDKFAGSVTGNSEFDYDILNYRAGQNLSDISVKELTSASLDLSKMNKKYMNVYHMSDTPNTLNYYEKQGYNVGDNLVSKSNNLLEKIIDSIKSLMEKSKSLEDNDLQMKGPNMNRIA